jgi:hypothetical protein
MPLPRPPLIIHKARVLPLRSPTRATNGGGRRAAVTLGREEDKPHGRWQYVTLGRGEAFKTATMQIDIHYWYL